MNRLLIYYSFIIVSLMVVLGFVTAATFTQLTAAVLFFPLFIYFASRVFPRKIHAVHLPKEAVIVIQPAGGKSPEKIDAATAKLKKEGVDIDRRAFLKLIGTAGLSLFLFSMFTKRAEAAFFGSVPGPGAVTLKDASGNKINPAEKQPTDGYKISRIDDSSPAYYGFTNKNGDWFIQQEDASGNYKYASGSGPNTFSTNWTDRGSLTYVDFENAF